MRFYEIDSGSIRIDGVDTKDVKRSDVHDMFSMVLQDTWLFEGTLRENLVYNQGEVSDRDLDRVCAACGLTDLVRQLPQGYDTVLNDDSNLSAGQRQLITIARAMLKDAPLLILDEATSSVDTRTELEVQQAMDSLTEGRTSFVIAHRLSTIKNADRILVLRDGDIVESGTHDELMAKGGFYADCTTASSRRRSWWQSDLTRGGPLLGCEGPLIIGTIIRIIIRVSRRKETRDEHSDRCRSGTHARGDTLSAGAFDHHQ